MKEKKIKIHLPDSIKNSLLGVVLDYDRTFYRKGNVFYLKKAFFVNSVISHYLEEQKLGNITIKQLQQYIEYLEKYVKNKINLYWKDGQLTISSIMGRSSNAKKKKSD